MKMKYIYINSVLLKFFSNSHLQNSSVLSYVSDRRRVHDRVFRHRIWRINTIAVDVVIVVVVVAFKVNVLFVVVVVVKVVGDVDGANVEKLLQPAAFVDRQRAHHHLRHRRVHVVEIVETGTVDLNKIKNDKYKQ